MTQLLAFVSFVTISSTLLGFSYVLANSENPEALPAGTGTAQNQTFASFMEPLANLPADQKTDFHAGKALAHQPWVKAPASTDARDGLGPLYNARTCLACHINGGRGLMPNDQNEERFSHFLRLSIPGKTATGAPMPEPNYGEQLQLQSTALAHQLRHTNLAYSDRDVRPEASLRIEWQTKTYQYPDGATLELRKPKLQLKNLAYGALAPKVQMSLRNAPPILGVGLIEQIAEADILARQDPNDANQDGISGRANRVWNPESEQIELGRFGLKANQASVRLQTAAALHGDMGIRNPVFPEENCSRTQINCLNQPSGGDAQGLEISEDLLQKMVHFTQNLSVPKRRQPNHPAVKSGQQLFQQVGCASCHHPRYKTQKTEQFPHLSQQIIWPYSDFLLHDMGAELADGRPDFLASGSQWRTPPLWGIGLSKAVNGAQNFLHDGRARTIEEAILWHGGEANDARQAFSQLNQKQRQQLIDFVNDL